MNWKAAHLINDTAFKIGAGWERKVMQMFIVLQKDKELSKTDYVLLLSYIEQELDKIAQAQLEALENCITLAYRYSLNATLEELYDVRYLNPSLALGYSKVWCQDGKDYNQRVITNINNIKAELKGLLLGWTGSDPIVLMGLVHDILTKAENEFKRLLRTEIEAASVQGCRDANLMKGAAVAVIENDSPCDEVCAEMVGEHEVPLDGRLGIDLPPYHPNCRCVFLGIFQGRN